MMNKNILHASGNDYESGVRRFLDDAQLYEEMLLEFVDDNSFIGLKEAYNEKDCKKIFQKSHALKGVVGNLDMTDLYQATYELTELLRPGDVDLSSVAPLYQKVEIAYQKVIDGIKKAQDK